MKATVLAVCFSWACSGWAVAYIDKGAPSLDVKVSWHGNEVTAVGTLNGELKGTTYFCPGIVWECFNVDGIRVGASGSVGYTFEQKSQEVVCDRSEPQRVFESAPIRVPEVCRMRLSLKPVNGNKPLVGLAIKPLQWN